MTNVFVLQYNGQLQGVFETPEAGRNRIADDALRGVTLVNVALESYPVIGAEPSRRAEDYPQVLAFLIENKKIYAIKELRTAVPGMGLKEAKDAVEAVQLLDLPVTVREAADKLVKRDEPVDSACYYKFLRDGDGDIWAHVGDGKYRSYNTVTNTIDQFSSSLTENQIIDQYRVTNRSDYRDEV
jgi:ribosomal protein L7/L12